MKKLTCHDCKKTLEKGDEYVLYEVVSDKFIKCKECYVKDPVLKNFKMAEVYSRVVGYIRPVQQWNKAKQAEYGDRKEFCIDCGPKKAAAKKIIRKKTAKKK